MLIYGLRIRMTRVAIKFLINEKNLKEGDYYEKV